MRDFCRTCRVVRVRVRVQARARVRVRGFRLGSGLGSGSGSGSVLGFGLGFGLGLEALALRLTQAARRAQHPAAVVAAHQRTRVDTAARLADGAPRRSLSEHLPLRRRVGVEERAQRDVGRVEHWLG